jgi:nucleotide-binding universal stress UspA family protein
MIDKILMAYDGSVQAEKAYDSALDVASKYSAPLSVVSVARPLEPPVAVEFEAVLEHAREYYSRRFEALKEKAAALGISPDFEVLVGHPAEQIVSYAESKGVDLIVMGHRGGSLIHGWMLGSVARRVIAHAHCMVLVVR